MLRLVAALDRDDEAWGLLEENGESLKLRQVAALQILSSNVGKLDRFVNLLVAK